MTIQELVKRLRARWHRSAPLEGFGVLDEIERAIGSPLPADYKYFLQWFSNGGEGDLRDGYLRLYPAEEVLMRQRDYEIDQIAPNLLIFAAEGDQVFCFDLGQGRDSASYSVVSLSLSSRDPDEIEQEGEDFAQFLEGRIRASEAGGS